jgi:hypothetical protein
VIVVQEQEPGTEVAILDEGGGEAEE